MSQHATGANTPLVPSLDPVTKTEIPNFAKNDVKGFEAWQKKRDPFMSYQEIDKMDVPWLEIGRRTVIDWGRVPKGWRPVEHATAGQPSTWGWQEFNEFHTSWGIITDPRLDFDPTDEKEVTGVSSRHGYGLFRAAFYKKGIVIKEESLEDWGIPDEPTAPPYPQLHGYWIKIPSILQILGKRKPTEGMKLMTPLNKRLSLHNATTAESQKFDILLEQTMCFFEETVPDHWRRYIPDKELADFLEEEYRLIDQVWTPKISKITRKAGAADELSVQPDYKALSKLMTKISGYKQAILNSRIPREINIGDSSIDANMDQSYEWIEYQYTMISLRLKMEAIIVQLGMHLQKMAIQEPHLQNPWNMAHLGPPPPKFATGANIVPIGRRLMTADDFKATEYNPYSTLTAQQRADNFNRYYEDLDAGRDPLRGRTPYRAPVVPWERNASPQDGDQGTTRVKDKPEDGELSLHSAAVGRGEYRGSDDDRSPSPPIKPPGGMRPGGGGGPSGPGGGGPGRGGPGRRGPGGGDPGGGGGAPDPNDPDDPGAQANQDMPFGRTADNPVLFTPAPPPDRNPPQNQDPTIDNKIKIVDIPEWDGYDSTLVSWMLQINDISLRSETVWTRLGAAVPLRYTKLAQSWWQNTLPQDKAQYAINWGTMRAAIAEQWMTREWKDKQIRLAQEIEYRETKHQLNDRFNTTTGNV